MTSGTVLQGYLDEISVRPGDSVVARLSGRCAGTAALRRLRKDGPASCASIVVPGCVEQPVTLVPRRLESGSGFSFVLPRAAMSDEALVVRVPFCVTHVREEPRTLLALKDRGGGCELAVSTRGLFWATPADGASAAVPLTVGQWGDLAIVIEAGRATLYLDRADAGPATAFAASGEVAVMLGRGFPGAGPSIGANARFEGPAAFHANGAVETLLCRFDFARAFAGRHMVAAEGAPVRGAFVNHPTRRMLGRRHPDVLAGFSDGDASAYAAIHVHEYDLTDAAWPETVQLAVPQDVPSGVYAVEVRSDDGSRLRLPFVVRPPVGRENDIVYLLPTNTYLAYANERLAFGDRAEALASEVGGVALSDLDRALEAEPRLGASLYDRHADGSGVSISSRRRPILNFSPDYTAWWCTAAPRHFLADLNIPAWLDHGGTGYDVVTDEDVHREGIGLLSRHRVLITGTHPEYMSAAMMAAFHAFKEAGRHMYLGANGFYWVTGYDPEDHAVVESRRGFAGTRNWTSHPLELRMATTGETGGLWRHRGLAPQQLTGIGFVAVGFTQGSGYARTPASYEARHADLFAGIPEDVIGEFGDILGGAAGDELDATDPVMGTPASTVVLAASRHGRTYLPVIEDQLEIQNNMGGEFNAAVRSEITITDWSAGGRTFAAGAINWCGSLAHDGFDNPIARLATNVLRSFLGR